MGLFSKLFGGGDPGALVELGFKHAHGNGVVKDGQKAVDCFRRAANQGHTDAQNILGVIFHEGLWGLKKDYPEAIKWHRLAAKKGWVPSQLDLGLMYDNGRGVPADGKEAFKWFRAALEGTAGKTQAHTEQLEKIMGIFLTRIAEASSGVRSYSYLSSSDERKAFAREIGTVLHRHGGMRSMKRVLDEYVGRIPGQRTIEPFWDGIGDWRG